TGEIARLPKRKEKRSVKSENFEEFSVKIMQTLTAGSFLNLENAEKVEALKFTARRLAEHTTAVIAENLPPAALAGLANDLWQKAEYVARETERRRLREIFVENFCEQFRELKPEVPATEILSVEVQPGISADGNINSAEQQSPVTVESVSTPNLPKERATEVEGKKDEFLGFVETGEMLVESPASSMGAAGEVATPTAQEDKQVIAEAKVSTENPNKEIPQSTVAPAADAKSNPQPSASAIKSNAAAPKSANALEEPFEFGKCTVSLNLTLLPSSGDSRGQRRAIVSATSHNLPPEIEFLEIGEGENLTEIAALLKGKLERFKQTLPAKYIERLRASKTNRAKKPATPQPAATVGTPNEPEIAEANDAKTNGGQQTQNLSATETEKPKAEVTATKENSAAQPAPIAAVSQMVAATNNVQPSLF
ncbi:MAG TPA: hypothetical protein VK308_17155, partial [Pyrinomonadaceae bacterium]|nr:hypothetical protein [Pyrinomonadaceae bacterium]